MGPILGDDIHATYGFDKGAVGLFGTHRAKHGANTRFALQVYGSKGIIRLTTGSLPAVHFLDDPSWFSGQSGKAWQPVTSNGIGKPETVKDSGLGLGNIWIVKDVIEAIEKDRQPLGSMYDGRAALEMILAVYESHRVRGAVELPLKNRAHPLSV
jgi:predicted dehydrogenase